MDNLNYSIIWWIHAEYTSSLEADYRELAKDLGYDVKEDTPVKEIIHAICKALEHRHSWLLIFDNATDEESLEPFLPRGCNGHVIITSRNKGWSRIGKIIDVQIFPRKESVAFLMERTGAEDPAAAGTLAETLGDLPLTLEQAAAFIRSSKISFHDYLSHFNKQRKGLWEKEKLPTEYHGTIATTWTISFKKINPVGKDILFLCAFLAPDNIPRWLIRNAKDCLQNDTSISGKAAFTHDCYFYILLKGNKKPEQNRFHDLSAPAVITITMRCA